MPDHVFSPKASRCFGAEMVTFPPNAPAMPRPSGDHMAIRNKSAINIAAPGPHSTKFIADGHPISCHLLTAQMPIISPNSWEISGEVVKSPRRPMGLF